MPILLETDKLLHPYLLAEGEDIARNRLDELFSETLIPKIKGVIAKEFLTLHRDERDEIFAEAQANLFRFLQNYRAKVRANSDAVLPLPNLKGYTVILTRNTRREFLQKKNPAYRRTKHRILHLLENPLKNIQTFRDEKGMLFFTLPENRNKESDFDFDKLVKTVSAKNPRRLFMKTHELVPQILREAGCPLALNVLIRLEMEITGTAHSGESEMTDNLESLAKSLSENPQITLEKHELLQKLWRETKALKTRHRKSLLLNMKEAVGVEAISLWFVLGIANEAEMAAALEVSLEKFEELFKRLPLTSAEIADELGISATKTMTKAEIVDNLRKSARDRLRRKIK